jgi:excisionase family DNA binding protein
MSTPGVEPRFYTLEDVATILNVRVAQVYALVRSGELPAVKIGGRGVWRVDRRQLESYIDRLHEETRVWAMAHPLSGTEDVTGDAAEDLTATEGTEPATPPPPL